MSDESIAERTPLERRYDEDATLRAIVQVLFDLHHDVREHGAVDSERLLADAVKIEALAISAPGPDWIPASRDEFQRRAFAEPDSAAITSRFWVREAAPDA